MTTQFKPRLAAWPIDPVLRRLQADASLSDSEIKLLRSLALRRERYAPGEDLVLEGEAARRPRLIVAGWAACQRVLADGRRQIFGFVLPGEALGFAPRSAPPSAWSIVALTALETIEAQPLADAVEAGEAPGVADALACARTREGRLLTDQLLRLGQLTAYERVAHLLLELQRRLQVAGLGDDRRFPLPLTQEMLADSLGLSVVHVNRTLQQLRREGMIELRSGVAILLRPEALDALCDYEAVGTLGRGGSGPPERRRPAHAIGA